MSFSKILFPSESRTFPGKRWGNVIFRSIHLCTMAVYTGGLFFNIPQSDLISWYIATAASGMFMMAADLYSNGKWIFQNRGFLILVKLIILGAVQHTSIPPFWPILGVIFFSGLISHGTANFRYYSFVHRRQI